MNKIQKRVNEIRLKEKPTNKDILFMFYLKEINKTNNNENVLINLFTKLGCKTKNEEMRIMNILNDYIDKL